MIFRRPVLQALFAIGVYALLAALLLWHGADLRYEVLGVGSDPLALIWCLAWWPHALLAHIAPLQVHLLWQPDGVNLAWVTSVPLLALLAAPLTLLAGPLLSYNLLTLAAPVLAAGGAYALCLYLTRQNWAAFCGGLVYGFSSYEMAESLEHLNLDFTVFVPLLLLIVLARLDDRLTRGRAALLFALALAGQFYISTEIALTSLLLGGLAWLLALALLPARRAVLLRLVADGALAGLVALPLLAPFLWDIATTSRAVIIPAGWAYMGSAHLFNLLVTTPPIVFYAPSFALRGQSWLFGLKQLDFTTGLGLALVLVLALRGGWAQARTRFLAALLLCLWLCSLGPRLWWGGLFTRCVLPWALVLHVPVLSSALPGRFALQASLVLGVIIALWVAAAPRRRAWLAILAVLVTFTPPHPVNQAPFSSFFRPGIVQAALGQGARVLILPRTEADASSFWQQEAGFSFSQTQGYLGMPPVAMLAYPAVRDLIVNYNAPQLGPEIAALAAATHTQYVLAGPGTAPAVLRAVQTLPWPRRQLDDTLIFTVPNETP